MHCVFVKETQEHNVTYTTQYPLWSKKLVEKNLLSKSLENDNTCYNSE
jgi:hypothetical protein